MPKDTERSVNPAQQQRKLEKAKALKKGKAELQARRNEKLARRNPDRLQRQIDDLKALEEKDSIRPREKQILEELEKDLRSVKKARDALGEKATPYGNKFGSARRDDGGHGGKDAILGKRKWDGERRSGWDGDQRPSSGSETDESVRRIPMPRDTPPPLSQRPNQGKGTGANAGPVIGNRNGQRLPEEGVQDPVVAQPKTTYESAPQIRDLRKEAVGRFVPNIVRRKQDTIKGAGVLVEPEELDQLEAQGYLGQPAKQSLDIVPQQALVRGANESPGTGLGSSDEAEARRLAEEEEQFHREMKHVEIEEVADEDL